MKVNGEVVATDLKPALRMFASQIVIANQAAILAGAWSGVKTIIVLSMFSVLSAYDGTIKIT